ncbi:MAG TPA: MATE family efflux transporter [Steroidobacteraceae bacterium]
MDRATQTASPAGELPAQRNLPEPRKLPAQRIDAAGRTHVDQKAVLALALPLMANSAVQIVLNLTDMWFIGHISTQALAAVGAVQWLVLAVVLVLGGVGSAVQTIVAQAQGARRYRRASQAVWTALWATLCAIPLFVLIGNAGHLILAPFGFDPQVEKMAAAFWMPRISGAAFGSAVWALISFFNGVSRPRVTVLITALTAVANVIFNEIFIFHLGLGVAGSGWATPVAQAAGLVLGLAIFLGPDYRRMFRSNLTWKPHARRLLEQLRLGMPMGLLPAADLLGFSIFQMMQVRLGTVGGAATQMVMVLTSLSYMPGYGIAQAGTTLVGQSIGAGNRPWAQRVGSRVILLASVYMGSIGLLIALAGPWLLPFFTAAHDAEAVAAVALGTKLLWFAALYQFFDGLNLSSGLCLRGAGDALVPAALVLPVSLLVFVPLAHALTFAPGQGWVNFLPQFGWGAYGGWLAVVLYLMLLGCALFLRWRSGVWQKIRI